MTRHIRIVIHADLEDEEYVNFANAAWMLAKTTGRDFHVEHDGKSDVDEPNGAWARYGEEASWS